MLKTTITLALLALLIQPAVAQNRNCATMEVLERQLNEDPALRGKFDSLETAATQNASQAPLGSPARPHSYPELPGFTPTGDPATDAKNFARAKQELYASDPALYLRLTSQVFPPEKQKTPRK
jgi:hypothetical protein